MMAKLDEVAGACGLAVEEITLWVDEGWVMPRTAAPKRGTLEFDDADIARLRLIGDLVHEMAVGREAVPVILHLVDQLHAMRRRMGRLRGALETMPEDTRARLVAMLMQADD
jgi:chaperone modulatory protein CbpM